MTLGYQESSYRRDKECAYHNSPHELPLVPENPQPLDRSPLGRGVPKFKSVFDFAGMSMVGGAVCVDRFTKSLLEGQGISTQRAAHDIPFFLT
jgi:hypothetical protein